MPHTDNQNKFDEYERREQSRQRDALRKLLLLIIFIIVVGGVCLGLLWVYGLI